VNDSPKPMYSCRSMPPKGSYARAEAEQIAYGRTLTMAIRHLAHRGFQQLEPAYRPYRLP
jgi:hypothetical protein